MIVHRSLAARLVGIALTLLFFGFNLSLVFEKGLVGTVSLQSWGRYQLAIGSAITQSKYGIGGFASEDHIDVALINAGLTDGSPEKLAALGYKFPDNLRDPALIQRAMNAARDLNMPPPPNVPNQDGIYNRLHGQYGQDVGLVTYARVAFLLFGFRSEALTYIYFVILGLSLFLFVLGHWRSDGAILLLAAMMAASYVLFSSPLVSFDQLDIKDPRFLSTLAAVPALHLLVGWVDRGSKLDAFGLATIVGQCALIAIAIHMRGSTLWVVIALLATWAFIAAVAWLRRRVMLVDLFGLRSTLSVFVPAALITSVLAIIVVTKTAAHPLYKAHGEILSHTFWHGVFYALQTHPDWDRKYGNGIGGPGGDAMPLWAARAAIRNLPEDQQAQYLGPNGWPTRMATEEFSRALLFDLARNDPAFVMQTFLVVRPPWIANEVKGFYRLLWAQASPRDISLVIGALLLIAVAGLASPGPGRLFLFASLASFWFAVVSLLPNWLVALSQLVMPDHFLWGLFAMGAAMVGLVASLGGLLLRSRLRA
jgi:hypothetical protein